MAIYNSAVCNCHSNDEFTPLMNLVEKGYMFMNKAIATSERITFGIRLRRALNKFTKTFVPHMKEEEEVFQPLLCKYFTQEELAEMKMIVIKLHLQRRKAGYGSSGAAASTEPSHPFPRQLSVNQEETLNTQLFNNLPNELILKIFSYINHKDKIRSAQVCRKWNALIYDRSNWQELSFSEWKKSSMFFLLLEIFLAFGS
jgi:F-box/leucine-rich repeat protein 5